MKNKKIYAIITLVAFMMTLMPVMAFADATTEVTVTPNHAGKIDDNIIVTFGEAIVKAGTSTDVDNAYAENMFTLTQGVTPVAFTATIDPTVQVVTIDPTASLEKGKTYTLTLLANKVQGKTTDTKVIDADKVMSITVPNDQAATTVDITPATNSYINGNTPIVLTFGEGIELAAGTPDKTITNANVASILDIKEGSNIYSNFTATIDSNKKVVTINPTGNWTQGAQYSIILKDNVVKGITTNTKAVPTKSATYTVSNAGSETSVTFVPANNATGIAKDSNITITFGETIVKANGSTINNDDAELKTIVGLKKNGATVPFTASFDGDKVITLNPTSDFDYSATYQVVLNGGVIKGKNLNTQAIAGKTANFTTVSAPFTGNMATASGSVIYVDDTTVKADQSTTLYVDLDGQGIAANNNALYLWAEIDGKRTDGIKFELVNGQGLTVDNNINGMILTGNANSNQDIRIKISSSLNDTTDVKIKAALAPTGSSLNSVASGDVGFRFSQDAKVTFKVSSSSSQITFNATVTPVKSGSPDRDQTGTNFTGLAANNGVDYYKVSLKLDRNGSRVTNQTVEITGDRTGLNISDTSVKTNGASIAKFNVSASRPGKYTITVSADGYSKDYTFNFGGSIVDSVSFKKTPANTIATNEDTVIKLEAFDAMGNVLTTEQAFASGVNIADRYSVAYVSVPSNSDIETGDALSGGNGGSAIKQSTGNTKEIIFTVRPDVAGDYRIKVYNNTTGKAIYADFTAAKFGKAVELVIEYDTNSVALGAQVPEPTAKVIDANGVESGKISSGKLKFSYSGKGVNSFSNGGFTVSTSDKFIGQTIVVTAVYDNKLVTSTELVIADEVAALKAQPASGQVDKEVTVTLNSVDYNNQNTIIGKDWTIEEGGSYAVVTAKPSNAVVSIDDAGLYNSDLLTKGTTSLKVVSNKEGQVKINVMIKLVNKTDTNKTKYIAGVATVDFGTEVKPANSSVMMITGQNMFVVDGKATLSPVAPFVENYRTYLPMRALAEALGYDIEWHQATQTVTLTAGDVVTQYTLGSSIFVQNGKASDMGAKVIARNGYTVLPVRFAGEAVGYEVDYTTDAYGVTTVTMEK